MREWSPAAKQGILGWLESVTKEKLEAADKEVELWRVAAGSSQRPVARWLESGGC
jgi:hypothetical protein